MVEYVLHTTERERVGCAQYYTMILNECFAVRASMWWKNTFNSIAVLQSTELMWMEERHSRRSSVVVGVVNVRSRSAAAAKSQRRRFTSVSVCACLCALLRWSRSNDDDDDDFDDRCKESAGNCVILCSYIWIHTCAYQQAIYTCLWICSIVLWMHVCTIEVYTGVRASANVVM